MEESKQESNKPTHKSNKLLDLLKSNAKLLWKVEMRGGSSKSFKEHDRETMDRKLNGFLRKTTEYPD